MVRDFLRMRGDTLPIPGIAPLGAAQPGAISSRKIARAVLSQGVKEKRSLQRSVESTPE